VLLPFFALSNPIALGALAIIGKFGWREVYVSALMLPGLIVGFLASTWLSQLVSAAPACWQSLPPAEPRWC
jgi:hypothetical protein